MIHSEAIETIADSRALVRSRRALPPHTDHHRARWIVWICIQQAAVGGESLVIDGLQVVQNLAPDHRNALTEVFLHEHSVFTGDMERQPMLTADPHGQMRLYYSYWLADPAMPAPERAAFDAFTEAVCVAPQHRSRLLPGDILLIDNHRTLHGRTEIRSDAHRRLTRYWIAEQLSGGRSDV